MHYIPLKPGCKLFVAPVLTINNAAFCPVYLWVWYDSQKKQRLYN
jgi:hypothetical protein